MTDIHDLWVSLQTTELFWLTVTLVVWLAADGVYRRSGNNPLLNPVLLSVAGLVGLVQASGTAYATYFSGAQFVHFLLGPATVALAVPLFRQLGTIRQSLAAILVSLGVGSVTAIVSGLGIAWLLGAGPTLLLTLAPKAVTTPIAMGIAEQIGGIPSLTAVVVITSGMVGAALGGWVLDRLRVSQPMARGIAIGVAAHGLGTARALQMDATTGAFAGLAMGLNGLLTALLLPTVLPFLLRLFR